MDHPDAKQQALKLHDELSGYYATGRELTAHRRKQVAILRAYLAGRKGRVLDIGCAAGGEVAELREMNFEVVAIDLSARMLLHARQRFVGDPAAQFCGADAERLPFASQTMDHVACMGVFEYLPDYGPALAEIHRVMRPGGLVVFAIPTRYSMYTVMERMVSLTLRPVWLLAKRVLLRRTMPPAGPESPRNLCVPGGFHALLKAHGFEPTRGHYSSFFVYPLDRLPALDNAVAAALEPLSAVPLLRKAGSLYLVAAQKKQA